MVNNKGETEKKMNRKLILIVAGLLAFVVTAGTYAYTYGITASTELGATAAGGDIATFEPAAAEPEWYSILAGLPHSDDDDQKKGKVAGDVPLGDLFVVNPHPDYTGDLLVRVYLTNTEDLLKAYRYLNMKLYLGGSIEADEEPGYVILSPENGVAIFNLEGSSGSSTISIIGGSYRLQSKKTWKWEEGWTIVPELYCEVGPR